VIDWTKPDFWTVPMLVRALERCTVLEERERGNFELLWKAKLACEENTGGVIHPIDEDLPDEFGFGANLEVSLQPKDPNVINTETAIGYIDAALLELEDRLVIEKPEVIQMLRTIRYFLIGT